MDDKKKSNIKVRVKYSKTGPLKFISHLDVMRYFQKNIRRAGLDIAYTTGLSPHQVISFAAPMPLMLTSKAEYFDAEFVNLPSHDEFLRRLNESGTEHMKVLDAAVLPEKTLNSMAAVTASSYQVTLTEKGANEIGAVWQSDFPSVLEDMVQADSIVVMKKTKTREEPTDIRNMIHELSFSPAPNGLTDSNESDKNEDPKEKQAIYMLLAAGSKVNLRPEQVLTEICRRSGEKFDRFHYDILRLETYMNPPESDEGSEDKRRFVPLIEAGNRTF